MAKFIETQIMTERDKHELLSSFTAMDTDKKGFLKKEDLERRYFQVVQDRASAAIVKDQILKEINPDNEGYYDYRLFVEATHKREKKISKQKLVKEVIGMSDAEDRNILREAKIFMSAVSRVTLQK